MSQPVYLPKLPTTVDGYVDSNASVVKQLTAKRNAFGGVVFEQTTLPNSSGGSVGIGQGVGAGRTATYNINEAVVPNMALIFNSAGGVVTPNFSDAILSPANQTNFVGVAKTATEINPHNWIQLPTTQNQPGARMFHAMLYIPNAGVTLLHGGVGTNSNQIYGDTLLWDGANWSFYLGGNPTDGRYGHAATVDTIHHSNATSQNLVLIFGGANGVTGLLDETWYYDGLSWVQMFPVSKPSHRVHSAMAFHAASSLTVLFGGYHGGDGGISGETWKLNLSDISVPVWTQLSPATSPTARLNHCMGYDPVRQRIVLFGGTDGSNTFNDTWEWDGTNWTLIQLQTSPPPRMNASMTYDPVSKVIVLFGGHLDSGLNAGGIFNIYSDVWYYDGSNWVQELFFGPRSRTGAAITYDKVRNCVFMLGGGNGGSQRDLVYNNAETETYQDSWELLSLTNQVDVQTSGTTYVYWDATGLLAIAAGGFSRGSDTTTVTVVSKLAHNFNINDQFFIELPGDPHFSSGSYTISAIINANTFTYTNFGTVTSSVNPIVIGTLGPGFALTAAEVPTVLRYLGAGTVPGTVTPNGYGSSNDGLSPIFGSVAAAPVNDTDGALFLTLLGNNRVGLVKMNIGAFYGFIPGVSPQIRYISPASGPTGTEVSIVGDGLNTTTLISFGTNTFGNVNGVFRVTSAGQVSVVVPTGAQTYGGINLTTSIGTISHVYTVTPKIYSVVAAAHSIGTVITITGTSFSLAAGSIGTALPAIGVPPSNLAFTGTNATYPFQTTIASGSNGFTLPQANIHVQSSATFPSQGTIYVTTTAGVQSVVYLGVSGGNTFTGCTGGTGTMATGNRVLNTFTVVDDQTISVTIPPGAITGPITLGTPDGYTSSDSFPVLSPPTITLISPLTGPAGAGIAVTGTGFLTHYTSGDGYGALSFVQGVQTLSATRIIFNDTTMTATVPSLPGGQGSTAFNLTFFNDAGLATSSQQFTIVAPPKFLTAASSTLNGAINNSVTSIVITSASGWPTSGKFFTLDGYEQISYASISGNTLMGCVRNINGTTAASHLSGVAVSILTFLSQSNDATGVSGDIVRIFGDYGFTGLSDVGFGSYNANSFNFINDGYITAVVPDVVSSSDISAAITVVSTGGISNTSAGYTFPHNFTVVQSPHITSITNAAELVHSTSPSGKTGDTVFVNGSNLLGVTDVRFAGMIVSASYSVVSSILIQVTVPANDGHIILAPSNGAITIKKSTFYTVSSSQNFTYYPPPTTLAVSSPAADSGGINGGYGSGPTSVTLGGANLDQGGAGYPVVTFGGVTAIVGTHSPTVVTVTVPSGANNNVQLQTAGGSVGPITFNVLKPVSISSFSTDWPYDHHSATSYYPSIIDLYGGNFRDSSHMTLYVTDPALGYSAIYISSFTFHDSTHITFNAGALGSFTGDTCYINVITTYPGGSYSASIYGLSIFYPII